MKVDQLLELLDSTRRFYKPYTLSQSDAYYKGGEFDYEKAYPEETYDNLYSLAKEMRSNGVSHQSGEFSMRGRKAYSGKSYGDYQTTFFIELDSEDEDELNYLLELSDLEFKNKEKEYTE